MKIFYFILRPCELKVLQNKGNWYWDIPILGEFKFGYIMTLGIGWSKNIHGNKDWIIFFKNHNSRAKVTHMSEFVHGPLVFLWNRRKFCQELQLLKMQWGQFLSKNTTEIVVATPRFQHSRLCDFLEEFLDNFRNRSDRSSPKKDSYHCIDSNSFSLSLQYTEEG